MNATRGKVRRVYPAKEHGSVEVPLEDLLTTDGELDLYPEVTGKNLFDVGLRKDRLVFRAGRFVGHIPVNDRVVIDVRPRVPFANLERVLWVADQQPLSLAPHTRRYVEHAAGTPSLLHSLAEGLVDALAAIEAEGLYRQYLRRTTDTSFPRGRILVRETMRRHQARGMYHRATVSWFEPSIDTPPNRCVKYAVWYLARRFESVGRSPQNRRLLASLNRLYQMFGGVALDPTLGFLSDPLVEDPQRLPKFGMKSDATWWLESPGGLEVGGSGLSATLRDYGRFGVFVLNGGVAGKERVVPQGWFSEAGSPKRVGNQFVNYGYMWWVADSSEASVHQGAFEAIGIFGQVLYINPKQHVVIVVWSARPKPTGSTVINDDDFFAAVMTALQS